MSAAPRPTPTDLLALPKVDLYRRLGGALTSAASPVLRKQASSAAGDPASDTRAAHAIPLSMDAWQKRMAENEAQMASSIGLQAALRAVVESARVDHVAHLELAVSPVALAGALGSPEAVFDALVHALEEIHLDGGPSLGWLISVAASPPLDDLAQIVSLAREHKHAGILGLAVRLAAEDPLEADDLLVDTLAADLPMMAHLAPDIASDAAFERLTRLAPARIAFGSQTLHSLDALGWIRQNRPALLVCLSAERATGMWAGHDAHPIVQMIQAGMQVSLATWAPGLLTHSLTDEYLLAAESLGLTLEALRGLTLAGVQASFLPKVPKRQLERVFEDTIFGFPTGA
jgi:adenosine deaminase